MGRPVDDSWRALAAGFSHIVVDARDLRGGRGDVSAACLSAEDLAFGMGHEVRVTVLVTDASRDLACELLLAHNGGRGPVVATAAELQGGPPIDLYLRFAAKHRSALRRAELIDAGIALDGPHRPIAILQTVLGNSESMLREPARMFFGSLDLSLCAAGIGPSDAGIYHDLSADPLRDQPRSRRVALLHDALGRDLDEDTAAVFAALVDGEVLAGARLGIAYGVHYRRAREGFADYLRGIAEDIESSGDAAAIIMPSPIPVGAFDASLAGRLTVIDEKAVFPERAQPGRIYVLPSPFLPRSVFVAWMACVDLPPAITGDGALSAAVRLGRPFVMPALDWNVENLKALRLRLLPLCETDAQRELISELFSASFRRHSPRLSRAHELATGFDRIFAQLSNQIGSLTAHLIRNAAAVRELELTTCRIEELDRLDVRLRWDLLLAAAATGNAGAVDEIIEHIADVTHPLQDEDVSGLYDLIALIVRHPGLGEVAAVLRSLIEGAVDDAEQHPHDARVERLLVSAWLDLELGQPAQDYAFGVLHRKWREQQTEVDPVVVKILDAILQQHGVSASDRFLFYADLTRKVFHSHRRLDPDQARTWLTDVADRLAASAPSTHRYGVDEVTAHCQSLLSSRP